MPSQDCLHGSAWCCSFGRGYWNGNSCNEEDGYHQGYCFFLVELEWKSRDVVNEQNAWGPEGRVMTREHHLGSEGECLVDGVTMDGLCRAFAGWLYRHYDRYSPCIKAPYEMVQQHREQANHMYLGTSSASSPPPLRICYISFPKTQITYDGPTGDSASRPQVGRGKRKPPFPSC